MLLFSQQAQFEQEAMTSLIVLRCGLQHGGVLESRYKLWND